MRWRWQGACLEAEGGATRSGEGCLYPLRPLRRQPRHRRPQVGVGRIEEFDDKGMLLERLLHDAALDADAAAVNEPHLSKARRVRGAHVLVHDRSNIGGAEGVKVEAIFDRNFRSAP
jgi:hypothetical protein